jgi:sugar-phosphatase
MKDVPRMIRAAIFDMDGLLIDSEPLWHQAEIAVFASVGLHLDELRCRETTGVRIDEVVRRRHRERPWHNKSLVEVEAEILREVQRLAITEGKALPGVYALLDRLQALGLPLAVASSSALPMIEAVLAHLGIRERFAVVFSAADEEHGKPHPAVYLRSADALGVAPHECLAFEDSIPGVQSAHAAGMRVVAVPDAHHYDRAEFAIADDKYRSLEDFVRDGLRRFIPGS